MNHLVADRFRQAVRSAIGPLLALLLFGNVALFGQLLWQDGLPRGVDMGASLVTGYEASDGSWHQLWNDSQFPGTRKHVSRFTTSELLLTWINEITGNPFLSSRLMLWGLYSLSLVSMYLLAYRITGSRAAGAVSSIVYVFNRGALLDTGIPLAAGFALAPLLLLAVHHALHRPNLSSALYLAIAAALFATATIPGFTYIVVLVVAIYVVAFFFGRAFSREVPATDRIQAVAAPAAYLVLGLLVAGLLSAYFLVGLFESTVPLIGQTGGYDIEKLSFNLPSVGDAFALSTSGFVFSTALMNWAGWLLAATALLVGLLRPDWRVIVLIIIGSGAAFFAANVTSPAYGVLLDNLPYFSLVRGPSRWLAITLMSYSLLLGIGLAVALERLRSLGPITGIESRELRKNTGMLAVAVAVILVVVVNLSVQLPALRRWTDPYTLPDQALAPFRQIADSEEGTAFATAPFLTGRIFEGSSDTAIDFGNTVGPALSGRTALGSFRLGGIEIKNDLWDMIEAMRTPDAETLHSVIVEDQSTQKLGGPVTNFWFAARVTNDERISEDGFFELRFHVQENRQFPYIRIRPSTGLVELRNPGPGNILASSTLDAVKQSQYEIRMSVENTRVQVWIDGVLLLETAAAEIGSGEIIVYAQGLNVTVTDIEVVPLASVGARPDTTLTKVLGLYNMRYFVTQPHTGAIERQRVADLPGLREIASWQDASLFENAYYLPNRVTFSPRFGLYVGETEDVVPSIFHLDAIALSGLTLVKVSDVPSSLLNEIASEARFIAVDAHESREAELEDVIRSAPDGLPLVYVSDLSSSGERSVARPYPIPSSLVVTDEPVQLLSRARNFVLEATLTPVLNESRLPVARIGFRVQDSLNRYSLELDQSAGRISFVKIVGNAPTTVLSKSFPKQTANVEVRLAASDDIFDVYLNGSHLMQVRDSTFKEISPIFISSQSPGVDVSRVGIATDRDGAEVRDFLAETGFDTRALIDEFPDAGRDQFGLFPNMPGYSARLRGVLAGTYRLMIGTVNIESDLIFSSLDSSSGRIQPVFSRIHSEAPPWEGQPDQSWFISEPILLDAGPVDVFAALPGRSSVVRAMMLVEVAEVAPGVELVDDLLSPLRPAENDMRRLSATEFDGRIDVSETGFVVFKDMLDDGWRAELDGVELQPVPVFGALNGFWVSQDDFETPGGQASQTSRHLNVRFLPQGAYRLGMVISLITFAIVALVLLEPGLRRYLVAKMSLKKSRGSGARG